MSPSRKRSSQSSASSDLSQPELKAPPRPIKEDESGLNTDAAETQKSIESPASEVLEVGSPTSTEASISPSLRQHPIPPPSEPKQYRAIGLVKGRYIPQDEQLSNGVLLTADDQFELPAILLGRVFSLVKNHLDLEREYTWVVYPRIMNKPRPKTLSFQIVGVWEPALLNRIDDEPDSTEATPPSVEDLPEPENGYFSIRGEVVGFSEDDQEVTINIRQMPRKPTQDERSFKLLLKGLLTGKVLGHFWDLDVLHKRGQLFIRSGTCIGFVAPRKRKTTGDEKGKPSNRKPYPGSNPRSARPTKPDSESQSPTRREGPFSRPIKKNRPS